MRESLREYITALGHWGWLVLVDVFSGLVGAYLDISGSKWGVPTWIWITLLGIAFVIVPFIAFHKLRIKRDEMREQLQEIQKAQPSIKFKIMELVKVKVGTFKNNKGKSMFPDMNTGGYFVSEEMVIDKILREPYFLRALFANDPEPGKGSDAQNVCAEIEYYDKGKVKLIIPSFEGRWAHTSQPGTNNYKPVENNEITMPANGKPRPLDIVMKYDEDDECYAHSNDTPNKAPLDFRDRDRVLGIGEYDVKVRIRGSNHVDETYWFRLINQGKGKQVELTQIS